jgi:hypothetical protein
MKGETMNNIEDEVQKLRLEGNEAFKGTAWLQASSATPKRSICTLTWTRPGQCC